MARSADRVAASAGSDPPMQQPWLSQTISQTGSQTEEGLENIQHGDVGHCYLRCVRLPQISDMERACQIAVETDMGAVVELKMRPTRTGGVVLQVETAVASAHGRVHGFR